MCGQVLKALLVLKQDKNRKSSTYVVEFNDTWQTKIVISRNGINGGADSGNRMRGQMAGQAPYTAHQENKRGLNLFFFYFLFSIFDKTIEQDF